MAPASAPLPVPHKHVRIVVPSFVAQDFAGEKGLARVRSRRTRRAHLAFFSTAAHSLAASASLSALSFPLMYGADMRGGGEREELKPRQRRGAPTSVRGLPSTTRARTRYFITSSTSRLSVRPSSSLTRLRDVRAAALLLLLLRTRLDQLLELSPTQLLEIRPLLLLQG